jgi:hypothetical protein
MDATAEAASLSSLLLPQALSDLFDASANLKATPSAIGRL